MKWRDHFCTIARAAVGGVLIYAGFMKAAGPTAEFAAVIAAYKILPAALVSPLAFGLPYIEMWIGLFVFTGFYTHRAALAAAFLFVVFLFTLASALFRGIDLASCGCFGADTMSPRSTLIMDGLLLALSLTLSRLGRFLPPWSLDRALQ